MGGGNDGDNTGELLKRKDRWRGGEKGEQEGVSWEEMISCRDAAEQTQCGPNRKEACRHLG